MINTTPGYPWDEAPVLNDRPKRHVYLVAYDVSDGKRLRRVAACCLDHGIRVQKSLFECHFAPSEFKRFCLKLRAMLDPTQDKLFIQELPGEMKRTLLAGPSSRQVDTAAFFG